MSKKYASLNTLQAFLDNLKTTFATLSHKHTVADITDFAHNHNDTYYTKSEIDSYSLITTDDIDTICGTTIQVASVSEVTF